MAFPNSKVFKQHQFASRSKGDIQQQNPQSAIKPKSGNMPMDNTVTDVHGDTRGNPKKSSLQQAVRGLTKNALDVTPGLQGLGDRFRNLVKGRKSHAPNTSKVG